MPKKTVLAPKGALLFDQDAFDALLAVPVELTLADALAKPKARPAPPPKKGRRGRSD